LTLLPRLNAFEVLSNGYILSLERNELVTAFTL